MHQHFSSAPPSLAPPAVAPPSPPTMNYNDHAFNDLDISQQLNAYNESLIMNSTNCTQDDHEPLPVSVHAGIMSSIYGGDNGDDEADDADADDYAYSNNLYNRPLSGVNLFLRDHGTATALRLTDRIPGYKMPTTLPEIMKQAWNGLTPAARAHYESSAESERQEYQAMKKAQQQVHVEQQQSTMSQSQTLQPNMALRSQTENAHGNVCNSSSSSNNNISTVPPPPHSPFPFQQQQQQQQHSNNNNNANLTFMTPTFRSSIAELASKLDDTSIDFLIRAFK